MAESSDSNLADLGVKVDANRSVINALGLQTAARFDALDKRVDGVAKRVDGLEHATLSGFAEMRARLDQTAAGQEHIVDLLNTLIANSEDH